MLAFQAIMVYWSWASLLMNLPFTWFPKAVDDWTKQAATSGAIPTIIGILFGRKASLDCLLQAWSSTAASGQAGSNLSWLTGDTESAIGAKTLLIAAIRWVVVWLQPARP